MNPPVKKDTLPKKETPKESNGDDDYEFEFDDFDRKEFKFPSKLDSAPKPAYVPPKFNQFAPKPQPVQQVK